MEGQVHQLSGRHGHGGTHDGGESSSRGHRRADSGCAAPQLDNLVKAVETEVIPRLLAAHRGSPQLSERMPSFADVERMCGHALASDVDGALDQVTALGADGVGLEAIYINLLGATARMLGEMWEQDRITFVDVTVALCTLHQVLYKLAPETPPLIDTGGGASRRRALFVPVPGECHVFGSLIVARFFSRAGWHSWTDCTIGLDGILDLVETERFDLVGLSIACDRHIDTLAETVRAIRDVSFKPKPFVLLGGRAVQAVPGLATRVGADAAAIDPASAVQHAETILDKREENV